MGISLDDVTAIEPALLHQSLVEQGVDTSSFWMKANSYRTLRGPSPGRGWLLFQRRDLDILFEKAEQGGSLTLRMDNDQGLSVTVERLYLHRADCVSPGIEDDLNAFYVVEIVDARHFARNPYYAVPVNRQFNVMAPAADRDYYQASLNAGVPWTWQLMLDSLWSSVGVTALGTSPTLPYLPTGVPLNYKFVGIPAWEAYHSVLERLGCALVLHTNGTAGIVRVGETDAVYTAAEEKWRSERIHFSDSLENMRTKVPSRVDVYFPRREDPYGMERTTPASEAQWSSTPAHVIPVTNPYAATMDTQDGTAVALWDEMPALTNFDGVVTNLTDLTARAEERAATYYRMLVRGGELLQDTYFGYLSEDGFLPGKQVAGVAWYDFGMTENQEHGGAQTQVVRYPGRVWADEGGQWRTEADQNRETFDIAKNTHPLYPHLTQTVRTLSEVPGPDGLYPGRVQRWNPTTNQFVDGEDCWVRDLNA